MIGSFLLKNRILEYQDLCICLENEAILGVFKRVLKKDKINSEFVNALISKTAAFINFNSSGTFLKLDSPISRLAPFPRLHFATGGFATVKIDDQYSTIIERQNTMIMNPDNFFVTLTHDEYMNYFGLCLAYRGDIGFNSEHIRKAFSPFRYYKKAEAGRDFYYVENIRPPVKMKTIEPLMYDTVAIKNYSGMFTFWEEVLDIYDSHYKKSKDILSKYASDGIEENEFIECRESFQAIIADYKDFQSATKN